MLFTERSFADRTAPGVVLSMAMLSGCGSCAGVDTTHQEPVAHTATTSASIEGVVVLADGEELPLYPLLANENQPAPPRECAPPKLSDRQPVTMPLAAAPDPGVIAAAAIPGAVPRGLDGVIMGASEFKKSPSFTKQIHEVAIRDCRLVPETIVATRGDVLRLTNETDYPFLPELGKSQLLQTLLKGESRDIPLDRGGVLSLGCGFAASCGHSDVVVFYHPIRTLSAKGGQFRLDNVPTNEDVVIHAWHPLFEEAVQTVRLAPGETKKLRFVLKPLHTGAETARTAVDGAAGRVSADATAVR